jgi:hypothetical protein
VTQVVEHLLSKSEALSSNPSPTKEKNFSQVSKYTILERTKPSPLLPSPLYVFQGWREHPHRRPQE